MTHALLDSTLDLLGSLIADKYVELDQRSKCLGFLGTLSMNLPAALPIDRS